MSQMKELYDKVAASEELRAQFAAILQAANEVGEEETSNKLIQFAKNQGYTITIPEFQEYFKSMAEQKSNGELNDAELDLVAGGKGPLHEVPLALSILSLGLACALISIVGATGGVGCENQFYKNY